MGLSATANLKLSIVWPDVSRIELNIFVFISFSAPSVGLFGLDYEEMMEELESNKLAMTSMFRTVDALDYSLIASVDVKHRIEQLALDVNGQHLALIEKIGEKNGNEAITQCRIYCVGRKRVSCASALFLSD